MPITAILVAALLSGVLEIEPAHAENDGFSYVLTEGLLVGGKKISLPKPRFYDGQEAPLQKRILVELAGSEEQVEAMMDNSPRAPNIFSKDEIQATENGPVVRVVDLWFIVYADLKRFDADSQVARTDGQKAESGEIKYECHLLKDGDVRAAGITVAPQRPGRKTWFTQILGELPNKVQYEVIDRSVVTQTPESVLIATRTDPAFAKGKRPSNFWRKGGDPAGTERREITRPYDGGICYAKVSRLAFRPGALVVEMHSAWVEPYEWYEGGGALNTKLKRGADEGIKKLREELAADRTD
jgi:hypothetical protein